MIDDGPFQHKVVFFIMNEPFLNIFVHCEKKQFVGLTFLFRVVKIDHRSSFFIVNEAFLNIFIHCEKKQFVGFTFLFRVVKIDHRFNFSTMETFSLQIAKYILKLEV